LRPLPAAHRHLPANAPRAALSPTQPHGRVFRHQRPDRAADLAAMLRESWGGMGHLVVLL
jgi:hypothetical protein